MTQLDLSVVVRMVDKLTAPIRAATKPVSKLTEEVGKTTKRLEGLGSTRAAVEQFRKIKAGSAETAKALGEAQAKAQKLGKELAATAKPSKAMRDEFERARRAVDTLKKSQVVENETLAKARRALRDAGVSTRDLSTASRELDRVIGSATRELEGHKRALAGVEKAQARVAQARERMEKRLQTAANLSLIGDGAARLAGRVQSSLGGMVQAAVSFESAMADVKKVVSFDTPQGFTRFGEEIMRMSREIPISAEGLAAIAASGGQLGIAAQNLPDFVNTVARMSTAFDMVPEAAGEAMAKLSNVYQISIDQMSGLGDAINHLSDNTAAKASDIVSALGRIGGTAKQFGLAATEAAALADAFIALGKPPEVAGTAINAMLLKLQTASGQGKKFQNALKSIGVDARDLERAIASDAQGSLTSFLETLEGVDGAERANILADLFGLEYSDDVSLLVGSLDEYRKALSLTGDAQSYAGSMGREFANRAATTANGFQLFQNRMNEMRESIGKALLPALKSLTEQMGGMVERITSWVRENPGLTKGIVLAAAAIGGLAAVIAPVALGIGSMIAAFGMASFGAAKIAASIGGLGSALLWVGRVALPMVGKALAVVTRAFMLNPVGLVVTAIAGAAYALYQNWDRLTGWFSGKVEAVKSAFGDGLLTGMARLAAELNPFSILWDAIDGLADYLFGVDLSGAVTNIYDRIASAFDFEWSDLMPSFAWPTVPRLDLGAFVTRLTGWEMPEFRWPEFGSVDLGALVTGIVKWPLAAFAWPAIGALNLVERVRSITDWGLPSFSWPDIPSLDIGGFVTRLTSWEVPSFAWPTVPRLDLGAFVTRLTGWELPEFRWPKFGSVDLGALVTGIVKWPLAAFAWPAIGALNLVERVRGITDWGLSSFSWPDIPSLDIGGFVTRLTSWEVPSFAWPTVPRLDLGAFVTRLTGWELPEFRWPDFGSVDLASLVTGIVKWPLAAFAWPAIGALNLVERVRGITDWGLPSFAWPDIPRLDIGGFVTRLTGWELPKFRWPDFGSVDLASLVTGVVKWPLAAFAWPAIGALNLVERVRGITDWGLPSFSWPDIPRLDIGGFITRLTSWEVPSFSWPTVPVFDLSSGLPDMGVVVARIRDALASLPGDLASIGVNLMDGLVGGVQSKLASVQDAVTNVGSSVIGWFKDKLGIASPSRVFATFGGFLMDGLVGGLKNKMKAVQDAINGVGSSVVGWFKDKLGIRSPSRIFAGLGGDLTDGLAFGVKRGQDAAISAMDGLRTRLAQPVSASINAGIAAPAAVGLALAATAPAPANAGDHFIDKSTTHITIHASGGDVRDIEIAVRRVLEDRDRDQRARQRRRAHD